MLQLVLSSQIAFKCDVMGGGVIQVRDRLLSIVDPKLAKLRLPYAGCFGYMLCKQ